MGTRQQGGELLWHLRSLQSTELGAGITGRVGHKIISCNQLPSLNATLSTPEVLGDLRRGPDSALLFWASTVLGPHDSPFIASPCPQHCKPAPGPRIQMGVSDYLTTTCTDNSLEKLPEAPPGQAWKWAPLLEALTYEGKVCHYLSQL